MADEKKTSTVEAVVVAGSYAWHETANDPSTPRRDAAKGETITVSKEEFERGTSMTPAALAKPGSDEAKVAAGELPAPPPELTKPDGQPVGDVEPSGDQKS